MKAWVYCWESYFKLSQYRLKCTKKNNNKTRKKKNGISLISWMYEFVLRASWKSNQSPDIHTGIRTFAKCQKCRKIEDCSRTQWEFFELRVLHVALFHLPNLDINQKLLWVQFLIPSQGCVLIYRAEILEQTSTLFQKKTPCQEVEGEKKSHQLGLEMIEGIKERQSCKEIDFL